MTLTHPTVLFRRDEAIAADSTLTIHRPRRRRWWPAALAVALAGRKVNTNVDTIPVGVWEVVKAERIRAGLTERQRPFSLLRLTGVPVATLRAVVGLESAVPLLIVAAVATGAGLLTAQLYLTTQLGYSLTAPGGVYYLIVAGGLVAARSVIGSALSLLTKITGPEAARNE